MTEASSSGIENSDIAILADQSLQALVQNVEKLLESRKYTIAKPLCAGRLKIENLFSQVNHAKIKYSCVNCAYLFLVFTLFL